MSTPIRHAALLVKRRPKVINAADGADGLTSADRARRAARWRRREGQPITSKDREVLAAWRAKKRGADLA